MLGAKFWFWSLKFLGWALLTIEFYVELSSNLSVHSSLWLHLNFPFNCRWAARYGIAVALPVSCDQISISSLLFGGQMLGGDCLVAVCDTADCSPSIFGVNITILIFLFYFWCLLVQTGCELEWTRRTDRRTVGPQNPWRFVISSDFTPSPVPDIRNISPFHFPEGSL